ncbi:accessory Sec system translocase SecA2 [candidate division KSB1 bacterium]|nr:accessory Sec system translocase SecA2 [candidate division KSB1 bacterium]
MLMSFQNISTQFKRFHQRLNGLTIDYDLKSYIPVLNEINQFSEKMTKFSDAELKEISREFCKQAQNGVSLDELLPEAYALIREVAWRVLQLRPYDVQIIGGIALHQGKLTEMQTGEGKTLVAVLPAFLNALTGQGVHVLTFNDYLARRDAQWMEPIYRFLGLNVSYVQEGMSIVERQKAYQADITYLTAKEAGFDFLRDSLCYRKADVVHRPFHFAIIDEADSILIDEARIPLVIAGTADDFVADTYQKAQFARKLKIGIDFELDEYARNIYLTDAGVRHAEKLLNCDNLHDVAHLDTFTRLNCALHAEYLLHRDVDYIVRNGKIELVDEFTGRIADRRRWPDGLQAAIEAKENISIQSKGNILNSITLQHFLQNYPKLCGMTATAQPAAEEFRQFYNLDIVVIPPNRSCIRIDYPDTIFSTRIEKQNAVIDEIIKIHQTGRPVLVGTRSVGESALLADELRKHQIECEVLNAKNDAHEAEIIAQAGRLGAVTISTNMAGRGTDILLGGGNEPEKLQVTALGGLYVIGTNKHESRRIDNQLRGRAGRQGDPGASQFIISLEDDLFVKYRIRELIPEKILENNPNGEVDNPVIRNEIDRIQRIIEGQNLEIKKTLYKYSWLIEKQRIVIAEKRDELFEDYAALHFFQQRSPQKVTQYQFLIGIEKLNEICKRLTLFYIDKYWSQYLAEIADIREGIHLQSIGGQVPFIEFQKLSIKIFDELLEQLDNELIQIFTQLQIENEEFDLEQQGIKAPSATWTYIINDNPFENQLGLQLMGNIGLSVGAAFMFGPLLGLFPWLKKLKHKK